MTRLESLVDEATTLGIVVDDSILSADSKLDGLYLHWEKAGLTVILINRHRPQRVQVAVMSEELGHFHTCVGNALDQDNIISIKKERAGRGVAYQKLLPLQKLKAAICSGTCSLWELADQFDLPEHFIQDAFSFYCQRGDLRVEGAECRLYYAM